MLPNLDATLPTVINEGIRTEKEKKLSLPAQSIAARERRRKIAEKTQELGKVIPGSNKMSTAEKFQAASKYVNLLQAQVQLLQLMNSIQVTIISALISFFFFVVPYWL